MVFLLWFSSLAVDLFLFWTRKLSVKFEYNDPMLCRNCRKPEETFVDAKSFGTGPGW